MNAQDIEFPVDTETERVTRWRAGELERAGYDPAAAVELAERNHVDLHLAVRLLERGCSPQLATQILL
jgi:hypothetical protein